MVYPLETVIAEKLETILSRSTLNCRMRDFYDIHILYEMYSQEINSLPLSKALTATAEKRESIGLLQDTEDILMAVEDSPDLQALWMEYQKKNTFAKSYTWERIICSVRQLCQCAFCVFEVICFTFLMYPIVDICYQASCRTHHELIRAIYSGTTDKSSGKRRQSIQICCDLVGFIPPDELMKQETARLVSHAVPAKQYETVLPPPPSEGGNQVVICTKYKNAGGVEASGVAAFAVRLAQLYFCPAGGGAENEIRRRRTPRGGPRSP